MKLEEKLARAGHAAVLDWVEEDNSHPLFKTWDELREEDRADLISIVEFELLNPDQPLPSGPIGSSVFLEGLFRGTVRNEYEATQNNTKEQ
jgi:hypothetical protein